MWNQPGQLVHEIFHARAGRFLARLAGQHHQHHPFDLLQVQLFGVEGQEPFDDNLALPGGENAPVLERQEQSSATHIPVSYTHLTLPTILRV